MPAIPVSRNNAWTYWSKGLIAATNIDMSADATDATKIMANLAIKRGHNAVRLWFGWAGDFTILDADVNVIATSAEGWSSTQLITQAYGRAHCTIANVATQLTRLLDTCQSLGVGVLLAIGYGGKDIWDPATGYANNLRQFWLKTYARWGQHPALIGLDILNEPSPQVENLTFAQIRSLPDSWPQLAQKIVNDIRGYEAANGVTTPLPLIVEGIYWGSTKSLGVFDGDEFTAATGPSLKDPKKQIVFSFHYYEPGCFTHQGVNEWSYEELGASYPLPSLVQNSYWNDGLPYYELRTYAGPADIQKTIESAAGFGRKFGVPIFVGEFSSAQPNIDQVYPTTTPPRSQLFPDQRVSEIQNNVHWQAPLLNKLTAIRSQADFDALLDHEKTSCYDTFGATMRRWITKLEVGTDGYVTATLEHIHKPTEPLGTGFRVVTATKSVAQLQNEYAEVVVNPVEPPHNGDAWALAGTALSKEFYSQPLARIVAPAGAVGAAFNMANPQSVKLIRHDYKIRFQAPAGAVPGTVLDGTVCQVPTGNAANPFAAVKMPVALLALTSPRTAAEIDQSRFNYTRDLIYTWQANGFSWAWFFDDTEVNGNVVVWRASKSIIDLLSTATGGRRIAQRA